MSEVKPSAGAMRAAEALDELFNILPNLPLETWASIIDREHFAGLEAMELLNECLLLFAEDHALSRFNWGASGLRAQDIRELNELPLKIRAALTKELGEESK